MDDEFDDALPASSFQIKLKVKKLELIPLINEDNGKLIIKGFAERKWAEENDLCHLTTILIPVIAEKNTEDRSLVVQVRDERKSFPCCRDVFGGHVNLDNEFWPFLLGKPFDLSEIVISAALREANEELRLSQKEDCHPYDIKIERIYRVGEVGEARWMAKGNNERSTIYLVPIPKNCEIHPMDNVGKDFFSVATEKWKWEELRNKFFTNKQYAYRNRTKAEKMGCNENKKQWQFADGIARVLENDALYKKVLESISTLPNASFEPV